MGEASLLAQSQVMSLAAPDLVKIAHMPYVSSARARVGLFCAGVRLMVFRPTIMERNFDSVLHPAQAGRPAQLIIRLKVNLLPYDPSRLPARPGQSPPSLQVARDPAGVRQGAVRDLNGMPFQCCTWLEREFNAFKIKFKKMVELSWNNQLILLPPARTGFIGEMSDAVYREFIGRPDVPAHVECSMDIQLMDAFALHRGKPPHAIIDVVRLKSPAGGQFRSSQFLIVNEDVEFRRTSGSLLQVTAAHEIGHWLGSPVPSTDIRRYMPHVDASEGDKDGHNEDDEYGRTLGKRMALMGAGQLVTEFEARPWIERVRLHTNALVGWDIVHRIHFRSMATVSERQKRLLGAVP